MDYKLSIKDLTNPEETAKLVSAISEAFDQLDVIVTTAALNGNVKGRAGQLALYNNSGSYSFWVCVDGATTWQQIGADTSLWEVSGTETQLKTADEIDMQSKKIINVTDPAANQDAATKKYVDDQVGTKAAKGANSDITSLAGLTTALSVTQGGTGATLLQRGSASLNIGVNTTITFPTAFANTDYTVVGMVLETTAEGTLFHIVSKATTGFVVWNTAGSALAFEWIAMGNA